MNAKNQDETVLDNHSEATLPNGDGDATLPGSDEDATLPDSDGGVTLPAIAEDATIPDGEDLREAENDVALDWNVGDTILDLYEVLPANENGDAFHAGNFGKVYKVHHKTWNTDLAVKAPHAEVFQTEAQKQNFISECQAWIELGLHPHIASCYYVRELGGVPRIFAEYVDGGSLKDWITSGRLYEGDQQEATLRVLDIAIQFAWGLHYAHEQGMIHQDVKPQNVMMTQNGDVKVVDFGLARAKAASGAASGEAVSEDGGTIIVKRGGYTPAYCSPEQQSGDKLTRRTDVWSWAVSVLEMLAGERRWADGVVAGAACDNYIADARISVPEKAADLLRRCFMENETERPHTMKEVADELVQVYEETSGATYPRKWAEGASDTPDSLNNRALSYLDMGDEEKAQMLWDSAITNNSSHLETVYNHGLLLWRSGRISDVALVRQLENIKADQSDSVYHYLLGMVHIERSDAEAAIAALEESAKHSEDNQDVERALQSAKAGMETWSKGLHAFEGHAKPVKTVAISAGNRFVLSGSSDHTLKLWNSATGQCLYTFKGHNEPVHSVNISTDSHYALSGSSDHTLKLWDISSGECLRTFEGPPDEVEVAVISADNRYSFFGSNKTLKLWDVSTGECLRTFEGHTYLVKAVAISADNHYALSGSGDRTMRLWDTVTGECLRVFRGHTDWVESVAISADNRYALSGSNDKTCKLWDTTTGECLRTFEGHTECVVSVAISADGCRVLSGSHDNTLKLWDLTSGQCMRTLSIDAGLVGSAVLSADGSHAVSSSYFEGALGLWRTAGSNITAPWHISKPESSAEVIKKETQFDEYLKEAEKSCRQGSFSEAIQLLNKAKALPGCDSLKEMRDAWAALYRFLPKRRFDSGWEIQRFQGATTVAMSADGRYAVSVLLEKRHSENGIMRTVGENSEYVGRTLKLWDVSTGKGVRTFEGHMASVNAAMISADNRYVLSGGQDKALRLWDIPTGQCLRIFKGHASWVSSVAISADNRYALSGSDDRTMKLWELSSGKCLRTFEGSANRINAVAISADGCFVLSGEQYNKLGLWDIATGKRFRTFAGHDSDVNTVALSGDGRCALSGSNDKTLKLWDISTGECLRTFNGHTEYVKSAAISADNRYALSGGYEGAMKLWDISTGECLHTFDVNRMFDAPSVAMSADGRYAITGSSDHTVKLWELSWEVEEKEQADWDGGAASYLINFLYQHRPVSDTNPLARKGVPAWSDQDFEILMSELGYCGYGWLRPAGVKAKLEKARDKFFAQNLRGEVLHAMAKMQLPKAVIEEYQRKSKVYVSREAGKKVKLSELTDEQTRQAEEIDTETKLVFHVISGTYKNENGRKSRLELYLIWSEDSMEVWTENQDDVFAVYAYMRDVDDDNQSDYILVNVEASKDGLRAL